MHHQQGAAVPHRTEHLGRALLLENVHDDAAFLLRDAGFDVERLDRALGEAELVERLAGVSVLGIRSSTSVTSAALDAAPELLAVGAFCIGTNQIDLPAAADRGVAVFNAPFSNTRSVVELALAEIIALTRGLFDKSTSMHAGCWDKSAKGSHEVRGRTLGIVGYGNIGSQLSVLAESLGMRVIFYDTSDKLALGNARRAGSLEELLHEAQIVSLHVDGRAGNSGLFGEEQFAQMRPGALFLNLSRGFAVDDVALRGHLERGHLSGAAVDVFPVEPRSRDEEFVSALRGLPNVILTPHIGGSTEEAQQDIGNFVAGKLRSYVADGTTSLSVNLPEVALARAPGSTRVLLLHENTPGVLARVNSVAAEHGLNVEGQLLATRGRLGCLLTDLGGGAPQAALTALRTLPETVRLRVIA
jgi:D-3-phosphoglycerate dehydrogenase / 2-oxoglutarate reductase